MSISLPEASKWFAGVAAAVSAVLVSFSVKFSANPYSFVGFLIGHVIWSIMAWKMQERALLFGNACFIPVDLYAIYIRL